MRARQKATLHVDAYPDQAFTGTIESLSPGTGSVFSLLPLRKHHGQLCEGGTAYTCQNWPDMSASAPFVLRPGMSVIATVTTRD